MKKGKSLIIMCIISVFINGIIWGEYLDVGDDPEKIQIVETKVLVEGNLGKARFSPDGEYISVKNEGKILILDDQGVKKYEIPKGFFSRWFPDSKKLFYHITFDEGYYFDLTTGKSHKINYKRKEDGYLVDITVNNELVLYKSEYLSGKYMYKYYFAFINALTGEIKNLGTFEGKIKTTSPMKLIDHNCLLYVDRMKNSYFHRLNFSKKESLQFFSQTIEKFAIKNFPKGKFIITFESGITQFIMDKNLQITCKFKAVIPKGNDIKIWTDDLIPSNCISVSPMGKLFLVEMETGYLEDDAVSDGVYIFNCKGKHKKILDIEPSYLDWSTKGDKLLIQTGRKVLLVSIRKA